MIVARAPYRISFAGGGTDLPSFYTHEPGAVLSTTIDQYIYVSVHPRWQRFAQNHPSRLARLIDVVAFCAGVSQFMDVSVTSDLPSGTGLGGSSALAAALLTAFRVFRGLSPMCGDLVFEIERQASGAKVGKQDACATTYGGFNVIEFGKGVTKLTPLHSEHIAELERHCLLCYTGQQRDAAEILNKQALVTADLMPVLRAMRAQVPLMRHMVEHSDISGFSLELHRGWELKRSLGCGITNDNIDQWYETALRAGAWGGKICGAGGGGFMLLIAPPEKHGAILEALNRPRTVPVRFSTEGARVVFDDGVR